jgi:hypothetical protein
MINSVYSTLCDQCNTYGYAFIGDHEAHIEPCACVKENSDVI